MVRTVTDWAGAKKLETELRTKKITQICRTSVTKSKPTISAARMRSLAIMIRFTFQWSTNTPAIGPMIASGKRYAMVTAVTCTAVPCQRNVIHAITPNKARKSPKILTNWASQRVRNALSRKTVFSVYAGTGVEVAILGKLLLL